MSVWRAQHTKKRHSLPSSSRIGLIRISAGRDSSGWKDSADRCSMTARQACSKRPSVEVSAWRIARSKNNVGMRVNGAILPSGFTRMTTESVPSIRRRGTRSEIRSGSPAVDTTWVTRLNRPNLRQHEPKDPETSEFHYSPRDLTSKPTFRDPYGVNRAA